MLDEVDEKLAGLDSRDQRAVDAALIELDGTPNKERIGANAIGVSGYRTDFQDFAAVMRQAPPHVILGSASPPEARERNIIAKRCEMYGPLAVPLFGHPVPLFANPTQQPLALKGPLADLTNLSKQASDSHDDPLAATQPSFHYYIACGYPSASIAGYRTLAQQGRFMLLEKQ